MSQLGGGIGTRGPGETQLETDRRRIQRRIDQLKVDLEAVRRVRRQQRQRRESVPVPTVALVGYTNAGKSTLFNAMTRAHAYAANQLFATLDTTTRRVFLPSGAALVVSDTVGFIRQLPHTLVAAFRATLEEAIQADLLLHVVDAASATRDAQIAAVNAVLAEIGAAHIPQILVYNKIDLTDGVPRVERDEYGKIDRIRISAQQGLGLDLARAALEEYAAGKGRQTAARPAAA